MAFVQVKTHICQHEILVQKETSKITESQKMP